MKFEVKGEEGDWADLSIAELEAIKAAIDDFKNGRIVPHAEAMVQIDGHIRELKARD